MVLVLCEMQLAWSRIWTHVAMSISYDDNHYTTGTSDLDLYVDIVSIVYMFCEKILFFFCRVDVRK